MNMKRTQVLLLSVLVLAGCGGAAAPEPRSYDLGLDAPAARLAGLRLGPVSAVAPFDSTDMQYRLAYRNAAEIAAYAGSRWAATPAEMLRKQLARAAGEGGGKCALSIEVQEFTQIFSSKDASEARLELRAALSQGGLQRGFTVVEPNAGPDAPSGAAALARAVNRAIGEIAAWGAAQAGCR
jgi:cholesterol transport system auxiliary component